MTVHFIGAGPGAADLITVRGLSLLWRCPVVLYAGSLVSEAMVAESLVDARRVDTASLTLEEIIALMAEAHAEGKDVARLHSGDPSLYGAIAEQKRRLDDLAIPYTITPGVPAFAAAAAVLATELTLPEISQTVILTRTAVRTAPMPPGEDLATLGQSRATLVVHLSINNLAAVVRDLTPLYGEHCPVAVVYRASWPEECIVRGTLATIRDQVKTLGFTRSAVIVVGAVLGQKDFPDSRLYAPDHGHCLRVAHSAVNAVEIRKGKGIEGGVGEG